MQIFKALKDLITLYLKAPSFILKVWEELTKDEAQPPDRYWTYHHPDCNTALRGCHKDCPKDRYEKTGVWKK